MNEKVRELLNQQINKELYSAYLYLDFSNYFEDRGLDGFANWYMIQAQEERDHAMLFYQYLQNNNQKVTLEAIAKPDKVLDSDMTVLKDEGIEDVDAFVAVTDSSEANIFACMAAKRFGVKKTIAEVENIDYITMAEGLEIGTVLNKKTIAASYIYQMLLDASVLNVRNLASADAEIVEFMAEEGSKITKAKIRDIRLPADTNIGAIVRAGEGILVNGDTQILQGDQVVVFCKNQVIRQLEKFFK